MNLKEAEARLTVLTHLMEMLLRERSQEEQEDLIGRLEERNIGNDPVLEIVREFEGRVLRTGPYASPDPMANLAYRRRVFGYDAPSSDDLKG